MSARDDLARELFVALGPTGSWAEAERLLEAGTIATFRQTTAGGWTTRMQAFEWKPALLEQLVAHPQLGLTDAAIDGDLSAVQTFLASGSSPDEVDCYGQRTPLRYAAHLGHTEVAACLLAAGAEPNRPDHAWNRPLVAALRGGHLACADLLWAAGGRAEALLWEVVRGRGPETALAWVVAHEPGVALDLPMHAAIEFDHLAAVRWLLSAGADIDGRFAGESWLMTAAFYRRDAIARVLIDAGIDVHTTDRQGRTAMHYAIVSGHIHDPDEVFDYDEAALTRPIAELLRARGLAIPPRATR